MNIVKTLTVLGLFGLSSAAVCAMDASAQRYAQQLASGGVSSMQRAAEEIFSQSLTDQELLDVAAEALAQNYTKNPKSETYADSMAWLCKALGNSGNGRYQELLTTVSKSAETRKLRSHCDKGADGLPKGVAPYQVGSVDLARYRDGGAAAAAAPAKAAPAARSAGGKVDFSVVKEGMSQEEVESLIGPPTAMNSHITGKAFRPFNFKGQDNVRMNALYKGVGRIVYSNTSNYSSVYRVLEIVVDPSESGYP